MKLRILPYLIGLLLFFGTTMVSHASVADSIGRRIENGRIVVLHKVESKQTVYAISKIYGVTKESIYSANPTSKVSLKVGQILKVPTNWNEDGTRAASTEDKTHTVVSKETLFSISKQYGVSVDDLKKWNNLKSDELAENQVILVAEPFVPKPQQIVILTSSKKTSGSGTESSNESDLGPVIKNEPVAKTEPKVEPKTTTATVAETKPDVKPQEEPTVKTGPGINADGKKIHTVAKQETLYGLSKKYGVSVEDLQRWNGLSSTALDEGQVLLVEGAKAPVNANTTTNNTVAAKTNPTTPVKTNTSANTGSSSSSSSKNVNGLKEVASPNSYSGKTTYSGGEKYHTVAHGEGLYGISKKYGVTIEDLKKWNHLPNNDITESQILLVSKPVGGRSAMDDLFAVNEDDKGYKQKYGTTSGNSSNQTYSNNNNSYSNNSNSSNNTSYSNSGNNYSTGSNKSIDDHRTETNLNHAEKEAVEEALRKSQAKLNDHEFKKQEYEQATNTAQTTGGNPDQEDHDHWMIPSSVKTWADSVRYGIRGMKVMDGKIIESGVCELIQDNHWDSKYNCLHHDAPIGTIIKVTNPENNVSVFVRVVGRLVEDSKHPHRIIRISHHAVERLAPARGRFAVEISFVKMVKPDQSK